MAANEQRANCARRTRQRYWMSGGACALVVSTLLASGCSLLQAPALEPIPTPPPTPAPDFFDAKDFNAATPSSIPLNAVNDPELPDAFRVVRVAAGDLVFTQSVDTPPAAAAPAKGAPAAAPAPQKTPSPIYGAPTAVHLAGILTPAPGQPGGPEAMRAIQNWTLGQNVTVEQDSVYPTDPSGRKNVQIFFQGRRKDDPNTRDKDEDTTGKSFLLNRMLVRSGYAVVDINEPTTFDKKGWLNDEAYARQQKHGLWGRGVVLGRRPPMRKVKKLKQTVTIKTTTKPAATPVPRVIR